MKYLNANIKQKYEKNEFMVLIYSITTIQKNIQLKFEISSL
jgi:hypothetical protein